MKVIIFDINPSIVDACKRKFENKNIRLHSDIEYKVESVENIEADFVVTAGNSHGIMGGGIDLAVKRWLGWQIEHSVQDEIKWCFNNYLPVGKLAVVPFRQIHADENVENVPHLIYAPTMEEPGTLIDPEDIYFVACKIFRFMLDKKDRSVAICGLGTLTGGLTPDEFAEMLFRAYKDIVGVDYEW